MGLDLNHHNIRAMVVGATGEFSFAENALSAAGAGVPAYPYIDFGNVLGVDVVAKNETSPVIDCYRGVRSEVSNTPTLIGLGYKLKSNEADSRKVGYAISGKAQGVHGQVLMAAVDGDQLAFSVGTPSIPYAWYNLLVGGAKVRFLTAVTIVGKVEGTDFVVDKELGRIFFLTAQTAALTPKISGPAIAANTADLAMDITKPAQLPIRRGYGRLTFFDKNTLNKVVYDHYDFQCELSMDTNPISSQDGKSSFEISLVVTVMSDVGLAAIRAN